MKEGDTYDGEIEIRGHINTETIPSKFQLTKEEQVIVFDLETTGGHYLIDVPLIVTTKQITQLQIWFSPK